MRVKPYAYRPLQQGEIRCLRILPARNQDDELVIEIRHKLLQSPETVYDALSYTWGSQAVESGVTISGNLGYLVIRENCWRFLKHWRKLVLYDNGRDLHRPTSPHVHFSIHNWIWIDSIFINQADEEEKNQQVRQMATIFSRARRTLIWLGSASENTTMTNFFAIRPNFWPDKDPAWLSLGPEMEACLPDVVNEHRSKGVLQWPSRDPLIRNIQNILAADYWIRLWIVQELMLSKDKNFILGNTTYTLRSMLRFIQMCGSINDFLVEEEDYSWNNFIVEGSMNALVRSMTYEYPLPKYDSGQSSANPLFAPMNDLDQAIASFGHHLCHDFRDKVFGLLGLTKLGHVFNIDYKLSKEQFFARVLEHRLLEEQTSSYFKPGIIYEKWVTNIYRAVKPTKIEERDENRLQSLAEPALTQRYYDIIFDVRKVLAQTHPRNLKSWYMTYNMDEWLGVFRDSYAHNMSVEISAHSPSFSQYHVVNDVCIDPTTSQDIGRIYFLFLNVMLFGKRLYWLSSDENFIYDIFTCENVTDIPRDEYGCRQAVLRISLRHITGRLEVLLKRGIRFLPSKSSPNSSNGPSSLINDGGACVFSFTNIEIIELYQLIECLETGPFSKQQPSTINEIK